MSLTHGERLGKTNMGDETTELGGAKGKEGGPKRQHLLWAGPLKVLCIKQGLGIERKSHMWKVLSTCSSG